MMKRILSFLLVISFIFMLGVNTSAENNLEYFNSISSVRYIGDVDGDGKVNSFDALQILRYSVGSLGIIDKKVADLNSDGKINSADALLVLKIAVLGLEGDYWQDDTEEDESKVPSSKAEIINYFNTAINKVKTEPTAVVQQIGVTNYLAGATTISSGIKSVYNMLGGDDWLDGMLRDNSQGAATYTGARIKSKFPVEGESYASKLTEADVASASCSEGNGVYTIKITTVADAKSEGHKHGQGHAPKAFNVILPDVVNENIPGVAKSMVGTASMAYPSSTVVITVDAATGNVLTAEYDLKWTINFDKMGSILPCGTKSVYTFRWDGTGDEGDIEEENKAPSSKADLIKFINEETAKAAKGSYKLTRSGKFIKNIDAGSVTNALNSIIHGVDENASLDSVVGGFLGIKAQPITGAVTNGQGEGFDAKYMLKGMNLTEADVTSYSVDGNKYTFTVKDCTNPNASSAMAHATNDYITYAEVNQSIANEIGNAVKVVENESVANYKNIKFIVTVDNGKITAMEYSYTFDATLKLKLAIINATGTGEAAISGKYTDIEY